MTQKTNFRHSVSLADSFSFHHERCLGTLSISLRFARLGGTPNWLHLRRGRYCDIVDCFKLDKFQMLSSWHPFPFPCLKLQALNVNQNQRGNWNVSIAWCPILSHDSLFQSYLPETPNSLQKFAFSNHVFHDLSSAFGHLCKNFHFIPFCVLFWSKRGGFAAKCGRMPE